MKKSLIQPLKSQNSLHLCKSFRPFFLETERKNSLGKLSFWHPTKRAAEIPPF